MAFSSCCLMQGQLLSNHWHVWGIKRCIRLSIDKSNSHLTAASGSQLRSAQTPSTSDPTFFPFFIRLGASVLIVVLGVPDLWNLFPHQHNNLCDPLLPTKFDFWFVACSSKFLEKFAPQTAEASMVKLIPSNTILIFAKFPQTFRVSL